MPGTKVNNTGNTPNTTQTYVSYTINSNTYYAYAGTIVITVNGTTVNVKWNVNFKDAADREFTSTGQATIVKI
jgi:hypothetical protein